MLAQLSRMPILLLTPCSKGVLPKPSLHSHRLGTVEGFASNNYHGAILGPQVETGSPISAGRSSGQVSTPATMKRTKEGAPCPPGINLAYS